MNVIVSQSIRICLGVKQIAQWSSEIVNLAKVFAARRNNIFFLLFCPAVCHSCELCHNCQIYHQTFLHTWQPHHSDIFISKSGEILMGTPSSASSETLNIGGYEKLAILDQHLAVSWKRNKISTYLLLNANRNSYIIYQMVSLLTTLSDLVSHLIHVYWKPSAANISRNTAYINNKLNYTKRHAWATTLLWCSNWRTFQGHSQPHKLPVYAMHWAFMWLATR